MEGDMLPKNELTQRFSEIFRQQQKYCGIPQCVIASKIGISPSAVSQIFNGVSMPKPEHLEALFELMKIPASVAQELRSIRNQIRAGYTDLQSVLNRMIISHREAKGISLEKLALLADLPVEEVQSLETCPTAFPTAEQCFKLAKVLECKPEDFMLASGSPELITESGRRYGRENPGFSDMISMPDPVYQAEAPNDDTSRILPLPELHIRMLPPVYDIECRDLIRRNAINFVKDDSVPDDCVVVTGATRDFGVVGKGTVSLIIRRGLPLTHQFALAYNKEKSYWRLGIMKPYRTLAAFSGEEWRITNSASVWAIIKMSILMEDK
jgi:transcriptional regulator with XRE-family HTH domain